MSRAKILSFIAWVVLSIWSKTIRVQYVRNAAADKLIADGTGCIYAFWHGRQILLFHSFRNTGIIIPASESRDGEIQASILKRFGFGVVRGSSKRKGDRVLLGLVEGLRRGKSVAIGVDGPRGPLHEVKPGVVYLAGKLNKPIIPGTTSAKQYWILHKIWDKLLVPVPFTRGIAIYGEPIIVNGISEKEIEAKRIQLQTSLNDLVVKADNYFVSQR
jgi:lysophospholipid acyltransferase (LPLAT)-like uncharacterized protein